MTDLTTYENYSVSEGPVKLEEIKILTGANYFSGGPVVRMRIDLGEYNEVFTNLIPGFYEKLSTLLPSMIDHHCSLGKKGGFFERVTEGTLIGHVIEHVSIELQLMAGMDAGFGKTRGTKKSGVFNVVYRFLDEIAGIYAGKAAINIINSILLDAPFSVKNVVDSLIYIREERLLGFSTKAITEMADRKQIPWIRLDKYNLVQLGTGKYRKIIRATLTQNTSVLAVEITDNKFRTNAVLRDYGVPVPESIITQQVDDVIGFQQKRNIKIVIKPSDGYQGKCVSVNLDTREQITQAFNYARTFSEDIIAQEHISGLTYRVLVINNKYAAAVRLEPATITGDGTQTIGQLVALLNAGPEREFGDKGKLSKVEIDENTLQILSLKGYTPETILAGGEKIVLKNSGNTRLGATSFDVTNAVHPENRFICERISKILNIDVAGIDILSEDIAVPMTTNNGKVIEVNVSPDFRMHINPVVGESREVHEQFMEMLFPHGTKNHVPLISVTGSKGKAVAVDILDYCLKKNGNETGVVSSKGLFVSGKCLRTEDMANSQNAQLVLKDPSIDVALIETPVETILNYGLGYQFADIGMVLNLHEDKAEYYEFDHIRDIVDIAYAKSVVAEEVYSEGFTILNADNEQILEMKERLYSKPVLFSRTAASPVIIAHAGTGGLAVVTENNIIYALQGAAKRKIAENNDIGILKNADDHMTDVVLAVIGALLVMGITDNDIYYVLRDYKPGWKDCEQKS